MVIIFRVTGKRTFLTSYLSISYDYADTEKWQPCQDTFWNRFGSELQEEDLSEHYRAFAYIL